MDEYKLWVARRLFTNGIAAGGTKAAGDCVAAIGRVFVIPDFAVNLGAGHQGSKLRCVPAATDALTLAALALSRARRNLWNPPTPPLRASTRARGWAAFPTLEFRRGNLQSFKLRLHLSHPFHAFFLGLVGIPGHHVRMIRHIVTLHLLKPIVESFC